MTIGSGWGWDSGSQEGQPPARIWPAIAMGMLLLAVVAAHGLSQRPPAAVGLDAPVEEFSSARAMQVLASVAAAPHAMGQVNHAAVRDHLLEVLHNTVGDVHVQAGTIEGRPTTYNLVAQVPGTGGADADTILAVAHYDSVFISPGAADDGIGTVAVVEAARAVAAGPPLRNNVVFVLTDGEEQGLWGAEAFVAQHPLAAEVDLVLNFESGGPRGPVTLLEVDRATPAMLRTFFDVAPRPVTSSLMDDLVAAAREGRIASTDFVPLRELGQPGFNFANSTDTGFRHTAGDEFWRIDPAAVQHQGATLLGLVRAYGDVDLDLVGGDAEAGAVWIALVGGVNLTWSLATARLLLVLVLLLLIGQVVVLARGGGIRPGGVARSFGATLGAMGAAILSSLLLVGTLWLVRPDHRPHFNGFQPRLQFPGIGPPGSELYWFGGLGLACGVAVLVLSRTRRKVGLGEMVLGANLVFALLAVLSTIGLIGASYLFVLPLLVLLPTNIVWFARLSADTSTTRAWLVVGLGAVAVVLVGGNLLVYFRQFTVPNVTLMAPIAALYVAQLVPALELIGRADRRLPLVGTAGFGALLLVVGLVTVSAAPIMQATEYQGPAADAEVAAVPIDLVSSSPWQLERVDHSSGRQCVRAVGPEEQFTWCALPEEFAPQIDVQQLQQGELVLLFGQAPAGTDTIRVLFDGGLVELPTAEVDGVPGRFFAGTVEASIIEVIELVAVDGEGEVVGQRPGFQLPDGDRWDRVEGPFEKHSVRQE